MLTTFKHISLAQPGKDVYSGEDLQLEFAHCFLPDTPVTLLAYLNPEIFIDPAKAFILIVSKEEKEMMDEAMAMLDLDDTASYRGRNPT